MEKSLKVFIKIIVKGSFVQGNLGYNLHEEEKDVGDITLHY